MGKRERGNFRDKKLLVISPHFLTFVKDQVTSLSSYFNEIVVVVPLPHIPTILQKSIKRFKIYSWRIDAENIPQNVKIYTLKHLALPLLKNLNLRFTIRSINKLIQKENLEFDLIHAHFTCPEGYVGAKLKEKYGTPLVITAHGYDIYDLPFKNEYWGNKISYALDNADQNITVSKRNFGCIQKLKIKTDTEIIPNGYDSNLFKPMDKAECRNKVDLPLDKRIILTVGNLLKIKGHKYLIEAMKEIVKKRRDVLCLIIGSGNLKTMLENQIKELGLEEFVKLLGGRPHNEIAFWMNACDLFVLPSLSEGNPTVMFECLGCGKPFIGTKVGGEPDIITSDDYGLLCEPASPEELAEKILIALDKEWDEEYILNYAKQFTWENIAKEIVGVYGEVMKDAT